MKKILILAAVCCVGLLKKFRHYMLGHNPINEKVHMVCADGDVFSTAKCKWCGCSLFGWEKTGEMSGERIKVYTSTDK